jgi:hypothetical protein
MRIKGSTWVDVDEGGKFFLIFFTKPSLFFYCFFTFPILMFSNQLNSGGDYETEKNLKLVDSDVILHGPHFINSVL